MILALALSTHADVVQFYGVRPERNAITGRNLKVRSAMNRREFARPGSDVGSPLNQRGSCCLLPKRRASCIQNGHLNRCLSRQWASWGEIPEGCCTEQAVSLVRKGDQAATREPRVGR